MIRTVAAPERPIAEPLLHVPRRSVRRDAEVELVDPGRSGIPREIQELWRDLLAESSRFGSPYYTPEFALAAAACRSDTRLLILTEAGRPELIWPMHVVAGRVSIPVGGALNDYHGPIVRPGFDRNLLPVLRAAGLRRFDFHSWQGLSSEIREWSWNAQIPDLAAEWDCAETYLQSRLGESVTLRRQGQKTRKMIRELGPVRLEYHDPDPASLDWLIGLKRAKYLRTGCRDFFEPEWARSLLHRLHRMDGRGLEGRLSILYAGETRVAAHFGIASGNNLHYWYPAIEPEWARYSPGTELYLQIVRAADATGIRRIEFGYGNEPFKLRIANWTGQLACGSLGASRIHWITRCCGNRIHNWVRQSRFRSAIRTAVRSVWPSAGKPVLR